MKKDSPEFKMIMGEMTSAEYLVAKGKPAHLPFKRSARERKQFVKGDVVALAAFAEFLKHAGPPPEMKK